MSLTNNKRVNDRIKQYIISIYDDTCDYTNCNIDTNKKEWKEIKEVVKSIFDLEVGHYRSQQIGEYNAFKEWCQGLPSIIDTCYYYNRSAVKDLGDILEQTEEERNKYSEEQAEERLTHLIYREIFK